MGGGDLNAKKAWHPSTLKNQERVWKAEQAAAEEKKRIVELEHERHLERERAELNKLAKSNLAHSGQTGDDRLHWMYEKPDKKVQQEEYLLGKAIDKSHEQAGKTEADEIPAVSRRVVGSSMLTVSGDTQVDLARKMREDPLLLVKERERAARAALLNNPVQRAKLTELLRKEQATKTESKAKKKKKKSKDLDNILAEKLQALSGEKGIDLASLLASEDSSSESSDEKAKKKKKKKKKKSKSKNSDSDIEKRRDTLKYDNESNNERTESDSEHIRIKKKHQSTKAEPTKAHNRKKQRDSSEDSAKNESRNCTGSYKSKQIIPEKDKVHNKRKRRHHSIENETHKAYVKKDYRDSSKHHHHHHHHQSSDDQQSTDDEVNKTGRGNRDSAKKYYRKDDRYERVKEPKDKHSIDNRHRYEREYRHRDSSSYRDSNNAKDDSKYKKDRGQTGANTSAFDKGKQSKKQSGLSEAEKASKLAEMIAAGAEREKQRERRVANQLAEKEREDRPNVHSRSRNVVQQLPDSLESRIHSNRHYIQRDQRHMNENFARR